jgi:hypothetical protein
MHDFIFGFFCNAIVQKRILSWVTYLCTVRNSLPKTSQQNYVLFLHMQKKPANKIYERLVEVFGPLSLACSTVTKISGKPAGLLSKSDPKVPREDHPIFKMTLEFLLRSELIFPPPFPRLLRRRKFRNLSHLRYLPLGLVIISEDIDSCRTLWLNSNEWNE